MATISEMILMWKVVHRGASRSRVLKHDHTFWKAEKEVDKRNVFTVIYYFKLIYRLMWSAQCKSQQLLHFEHWFLVWTGANYDPVTAHVPKHLFFYRSMSIQQQILHTCTVQGQLNWTLLQLLYFLEICTSGQVATNKPPVLRTQTHTHTHTHILHTYTYTCMYVETYTQYIDTLHIYIYIYIWYIYTHTHTHIHAYVLYIHTYTYLHT